MPNTKYIVFKRDEWYDAVASPSPLAMEDLQPVEDAVVIRRQDTIAPPVLDLYAGIYSAFAEILRGADQTLEASRVQKSADYFHQEATASWKQVRKLPD